MAVLHSWPLASDPAHLSRLDNDDAALNTWTIAWVAHILPRDPLSLFEAPVFYPERHTLAYSEHLIVPAILGAPLLWAGLSPVLVHNLLLLAGFTLSGWAMYLLMTRWTGSAWAGVVSGLLFAFNAHVLTRFAHLQAQHVEFFPLILYALDRVLTERPSTSLRASPSTSLRASRWRHAVLLATAFVLQSLCSNYLLVFMTFSIVVATAVRAPFGRLPARELLVAGAISIVALAPFLWPYYEVSRDQGLVRSVDEVAQYSAGWRDYLATGGRLHFSWWSHRLFEGRTALFPGVIALLLSAIVFTSARLRRDPRVRMAIAIGLLGFVMSLGTSLPGYAWLHTHIPLLSGLRNVARWGWLALAAVSILAGFGVAELTYRKWPQWRAMAMAICALVTLEAIRTPVGYTTFAGFPRIYNRLRAESQVILAEFPFYSGGLVNLNGPYMLANTRYFMPLINGYSGFQPASFEARGRVLEVFPGEAALAELRALHVTHVTVHTEPFVKRYGEPALKAIDAVPELQLAADQDGIRLYRMR